MNRVEDTKGNYFTVFYTEDNAQGEYLPKRIDYTGNITAGLQPYASVIFSYEKRPDSIPSYISGSLVQSTQRLAKVETWEGADKVRSYSFSYHEGAITKRSYLTTVTECGTDNSCFTPTQLTWEEEKASFETPKIWLSKSAMGDTKIYSNDGRREVYVDLNGDGFSDKAWIPNGRSDLWVALSNGNGFEQPSIWLEENAADGYYPHADVYSNETYADLNGDGLVDRVWIPQGLNELYVALSTGSGFKKPEKWLDKNAAIAEAL